MNQIPNIEETNTREVEERVRELLYGHPQKYPKGSEEWAITSLVNMFRFTTASKETMELCLTKQMVYIVNTLRETHRQQLQKAREESGKEMFNRIKADITKLEYETDGDTFKKIVLSRLSSLAWFDALHHSELDQPLPGDVSK